MKLSRLFVSSGLLLSAIVAGGAAAEESSQLLPSIPAGAPLVMHVRDLSTVMENWQHTPFARMWADPEVQTFFAPAIAKFNSPEAEAGFGKLEEATGMTPAELIALLPGEFVFALYSLPGPAEEAQGIEARGVVGAHLGENRAKIEELIGKLQSLADEPAEERIEEFQGEKVHVQMKEDEETGETVEDAAWAIVGDTLWFGTPKDALHEVIASFKRGGADAPITTSASFAPVYQRNPGAQAAFFLDLEKFVALVQAQIAAKEQEAAAAAAESTGESHEGEEGEMGGEGGEMAGEAPPQPSMLEQMGLTPDVIVHALGLDALRGMYGTLTFSEKSMDMTMGVNWTEQRGLLRLFAYGDAPAPTPDFVPPDWTSVSATRFRMSEIMEAIKEAARTANPMLEFMLTQQLAGLKQQLGIDLETDFFGAFGDEFVVAATYPEEAVENPYFAGENLWAASLTNAEAFNRVLETGFGMAPAVGQQFQKREYLGHTINSINVPLPLPGGAGMFPISYAVTPTHLLIDLNGSAMIETALQRLNGEGEQFWTQPKVVAAREALPPGSSSFSYQDIRPVVRQVFNQWAMMANNAASLPMFQDGEGDVELDEDGRPLPPPPDVAEEEEGFEFVDPAAVPSEETIAKYWSISTGGVYREADGIRVLMRINNNVE